MGILYWLIQIALALLFFAGGYYKLTHFADLARQINFITPVIWRALGGVELAGALLLIVPALLRRLSWLTPLTAAILAVESLALAACYASVSLHMSAENPFVWALGMSVFAFLLAKRRLRR